VKINPGSPVRPSKFGDRSLNQLLGDTFGRWSDESVSATLFRCNEIRVTRDFRYTWAQLSAAIVGAMTANANQRQQMKDHNGWNSAAAELTAYLDIQSANLDSVSHVVHEQIALCDRVIGELCDGLGRQSLTSTYRLGAPRAGSPMYQLEGSYDAFRDAEKLIDTIKSDWVTERKRLVALADTRNDFTMTAGSVSLTHIDRLSWSVFEEQVARLLERDGCTVQQRCGRPGEIGADIKATTPDRRRVVVQCKHSTSTRAINPRYLYELNGTAWGEHHANLAALVTNGTFTEQAHAFARKNNIHVIDRPALKLWATYGETWVA
jgi:hypothetical protein